MVENAYKVTPGRRLRATLCGALWKRATTQGRPGLDYRGLSSWLLSSSLVEESPVPPQLIGLAIGFVGME